MKQKASRSYIYAIIAGLAVFVGLQLATLNRWSVWHDEGYTSMLIDYDWGEMVQRAQLDVHPPLYYLVIKAWALGVGDSTATMRMFSVICMAAVFILTLLLIRRLVGRRAAVWVLPVLALSPALVRYGQEIRMYGMTALLALVATHLLLSILKRRRNEGRLPLPLILGYIVTIALLAYTHYFATLLVLSHWVVFVAEYSKGQERYSLKSILRLIFARERWWLISYLAVFLLYLPWLPSLWDQLTVVDKGFWIGEVTTSSWLSTLSNFVIFRPEWLSWRLTGWYAVLAIGILLLSCYYARLVYTSRLTAVAKSLLLLYWSLPMVALFLLSLPPMSSYYYDRYFVTFAPLYYGFLGVGVYLDWQRREDKGMLLTVLRTVFLGGALLFGMYNVQVFGNNYGHAKDDYFTMQQLSRGFRQHYQEGDAIVAFDLGQYFDARHYLKGFIEPLLYAPNGLDKYGNTSLIYDREDLLVHDLKEFGNRHRGRVWFLSGRNADQSAITPESWIKTQTVLSDGYAKFELYEAR